MRKNSPRKWLHACLDLLPVILIPVFMIYSHRHTIDTYAITREEPNYVDFYQGIKNGKPNGTLNDIHLEYGSILEISDNDFVSADVSFGSSVEISFDSNLQVHSADKVYYSLVFYVEGYVEDGHLQVYENSSGGEQLGWESFDTPLIPTFCSTIVNDFDSDLLIDSMFLNCETSTRIYVKEFQMFNLTTIFGSGNEPTKEAFESYLIQDYYNFGINSVYVGMHDVTYNDTDIGSQFFYCLYNSVDKYFNMGNVFNLGGVYNWFIFNIMGGSSPLSLYIVWNIVLYEFVMDLLFLLYGLFMWFIDMVEHLMEKPFKSIK